MACKRLLNVADLNEDNPWKLLPAHLESEGFDGSAHFQSARSQELLPAPDPHPWADRQGHVATVPFRHQYGTFTHARWRIAGDLDGLDLPFHLLNRS